MSVAPRRVSIAPRRVSIAPRRVSVAPRRVSVASRRVSVASRRVSIAPRRVSIASRRVSIAPRRVSIASRRVSIASRRVSIASRRVSIASRRVSIASRRVSIAPRRVSIAPRRVSIAPRRVSIASRRVSIASRRVSIASRRVSIAPDVCRLLPGVCRLLPGVCRLLPGVCRLPRVQRVRTSPLAARAANPCRPGAPSYMCSVIAWPNSEHFSSLAPSIWRWKSYVTVFAPITPSMPLRMSVATSFQPRCSVKAAIVRKYFRAWAGVMVGTAKRHGQIDRIAYIDLFAGPGRFKDGSTSTPLRVLEQAIEHRSSQKPATPQLIVPVGEKKSWRADSNRGPADYESAALPTELRQHSTSHALTICMFRVVILWDKFGDTFVRDAPALHPCRVANRFIPPRS